MRYWIATVTFKDGTELKTQPFFEYDAGFKVWSAEFSAKFKSSIDHIDCERFDSKDDDDIGQARIRFAQDCGERLGAQAKHCEMVLKDMSKETAILKRKIRRYERQGKRKR